jgi:hypothetical protein
MTSTTLDTAAVRAAACRDRVEADAAESRLLQRDAEWADRHRVTDPDEQIATYGDTPVSLAGAGAPHVSHFVLDPFLKE